MFRLMMVVLLLIGLAGCDSLPGGTAAPKAPVSASGTTPAQPEAAPDNWTRMKDCAARADQVLKEIRTELGNGTVRVNSYENHYNAQQERCYLRVDFINPKWNKSDKDAGIPLMYYELIDAFETRTLATCNDTGATAFCEIKGMPDAGCTACRTLVSSRMTD